MGTSLQNQGKLRKGSAITSLVLGIVGLGLGILSGLPAVLLGIRGRRLCRSYPDQYGGRKLATAGIWLGAFSLLVTAFQVSVLRSINRFAKTQGEAQQCAANLLAVGRSLQGHAIDHGHYPDQLLELRGTLRRPEKLWCPGDTNRSESRDWNSVSPENISFQLVRPGATESESQKVSVLRCPVHGAEWWGDGRIHRINKSDDQPPQ